MKAPLELLLQSAPLFLKGALMTLKVFFLSGILSLFLGAILGTLSSFKMRLFFLSRCTENFTFVLRGVPFYVQLLIVYFVLPDLFGFNLDPFSASVLSLGLCSSGYVAQIVRGAINAIAEHQWEAALVLGYSKTHALIKLILPQTLRLVLAPLNNELDALLKSTSVISSIGILEMTRVSMNVVSKEMQPVPVYLFLALFYLSISWLMNQTMKILEKRVSYAQN